MRELKMVGLDADGKHIICEGDDSAEQFKLPADDRLRAALRGDTAARGSTAARHRGHQHAEPQGNSVQDPRRRIRRAGGSGVGLGHRADPPVRPSGVAGALSCRRAGNRRAPSSGRRPRGADSARDCHHRPGVSWPDPDGLSWDAWRNEDGRWTVQLAWKAGRSDNMAHFCFVPGAHGGIGHRARRRGQRADRPELRTSCCGRWRGWLTSTSTRPAKPAAAARPEAPVHSRRGRPVIPAWEDVLLGVRSSGQR